MSKSPTLEFAMSNFMDDGTTPYFSALDSDFSTGYLEDALFEFHHPSKRRRFLFLADDDDDDHQTKNLSDPIKSYWNWNYTQNYSENYDYLSQITTNLDGFSGEAMNGGSVSRMSENATIFKEMKTAEEGLGSITASDTSWSSSDRDSVHTKSISDTETLYSTDHISPSGVVDHGRRKKKMMTRVVYPFAVVKPGGIEGVVTLKDINERILMPPVRPVRHPVGDFACRPLVSANGTVGLSGKAVTAITRIQTQGRGTVTIIRTQG
ncbi:uncharacterized protein LOC132295503 isoform X3 [Cornus florida]|uniref:uncharacterized protein LOC132295503 isoform X3 n=2 Tax=Cornus florida TaxID=4283 RepID=UPI00289993E5|nr:uncharacterized protein LOC132295503 isoform X3 [Cornus florida]